MDRLRLSVWRLWPDSLFARLALLLALAVLASHVLALSLMFEVLPRPPLRPGGVSAMPSGMGVPHAPPPPGVGAAPLAAHPPGLPPPPPGLWHWGFALDIGVRLAALMLAAWVAARWLARPVAQLSQAAQALGDNLDAAPVPERGPREVVQATRVLNRMQQRIQAQLQQRARLVAAVSHDLRTPLTRLALRAQSIDDNDLRRRIERDVDEMHTMIRATLDYLQGAAQGEAWACVDLAALVQAVACDYQEADRPVQLLEPLQRGLAAHAQLGALRRCLCNLIDNALRYGGHARVGLAVGSPGWVQWWVEDDGPGIAAAQREQVLQPWYRADASRQRGLGGVGLGLAIVQEVVQRHQGRLLLEDSASGGLRVRVLLPVSPAPPPERQSAAAPPHRPAPSA
ncbi:MAG: ATP-binding protein [Rhodoferax sp.]